MSQTTDIASSPVQEVKGKGFFNFRSGRNASEKKFLASALIPLLLYMAFWTLLPIVWAFVLSFFEYSARRQGGPILGLGGDNPFVGLQHFRNMFDFSPDAPLEVHQFHNSVKTTWLFAFLVVPLNLAITLPLAAMIESVHVRFKVAFRTIFFIPIVTSAVGVAIMWGYILHPQRGILNAVISQVTGQLTAINWMNDQSLVVFGIPVALIGVIAAYLWMDIGYNLIIFIAALQSIPDTIREAAIIDGAGELNLFRYITLPLLRPTIFLAAILTMISAMQVFDVIQVMTDGGGPNEQTRVMVIDIYDNAFRFQKMGWAAAVSTVLFIMIFVISQVQSRLLQSDWEY